MAPRPACRRGTVVRQQGLPLSRRLLLRLLGGRLFERHELLGAERLVVDLRGGFDQILQVSPIEISYTVVLGANASRGMYGAIPAVHRDENVPGQKVAQIHKLAMPLVLDIDHAPSVLAAPDGLAVDDDGFLGTDDGKGKHLLFMSAAE